MGRVTTTEYANYCGPVLPNPPCHLSVWEKTGDYQEKIHDFWQNVDLLLFSHYILSGADLGFFIRINLCNLDKITPFLT